MTERLITPREMAALSMLTTTPVRTAQLPPASVLPRLAPTGPGLPAVLGRLVAAGMARKTDSGGATHATMWAITEAGQQVLDAYRRTHT